MHKLVFRSAKPRKREVENTETANSVYAEGKIIRKINIVTLDPFGQSVTDTTRMPKNWGERAGNSLHLKSKNLAIRNLLLFKRDEPYNGYQIKETERIIRSQKYISRVKITEQLVSTSSDSVDVTIRVLDSWSLLPKFAISSSKTTIGFDERNVFGTGHQLKYKFTQRFDDSKNANNVEYFVPNLLNTFISTQLFFNNDLDGYYNKGLSIDRPFYSALTKWAGGVYLAQNFRRDSLQAPDLSYQLQNFKYSTHDFWGGRAFKVSNNKMGIDKTTNLIISGRFLNIEYVEQPDDLYDKPNFFSNEKQFLVGVGINTREFIKDRYLFRYGVTEDVPVGTILGLTGGYQYKNEIWKPYVGGQVSYGNYFKWGFLSTNFEVGTFFYQGNTYQTAFNFEVNYFTNLMQWGDWKFRQFIKPQLIIGLNREDSIGDLLNLNERNGLPAFDTDIYGRSKAMLTVQTQTYTPKEIWGFRLNPYLNYTIGFLGDDNRSMARSKPFSKVSLGLLISNDYLVFSSFQLSISYYPNVPYEGGSSFKTNAFQSADFGFQNFELNKPRTVDYN
ncbi:hypothetical protein [Flavobacterium sp. TAB 87]|uniref:hypothetical protein n=1 Tax=Flavobacterium sp. TAB 87 TaxID=1729581 RepID=UPI00076D4405|nr:hypothetical protein [Flavobacterium sp. TAB 87]KVV15245.1 Outer membrane protein/protective antigen OMA87 [Flavobacterium sp. TAB 87]